MFEFAAYVHPRSEFFEDFIETSKSSVYESALKSVLPPDWYVSRMHMWLKAEPCRDTTWSLPRQGFKIHVSGTLLNALDVISAVVPVCTHFDVPFKMLADPSLLEQMNSKHAHRGHSGKFFTIYPTNFSVFVALLETLHAQTSHLDGPYILSDKRYPGSKLLFYRYGGFLLAEELGERGERRAYIDAPDGSRYYDERLPKYVLPPWVDEPFPEPEQNADVDDQQPEAKIGARYQVESSLQFSNAGGVYKARDLSTGDLVVIKEARPLTALHRTEDGTVYDSVAALNNEAEILLKLQSLPCVPRLIDRFSEWEHTFLVEEFLEGVPLSSLRAHDDFALLPFEWGDHIRVSRFCTKFFKLAYELLAQFEDIHRCGVILGDVSEYNIRVDPKELTVRLFDFETSYDGSRHAKASVRWVTPGYASKTRLGREALAYEDDWYALGMLLYSLVLPVQPLFALEDAARETFLTVIERSISLPADVGALIQELWHGNAQAARDIASYHVAHAQGADPVLRQQEPDWSQNVLEQDIHTALVDVSTYLERHCTPNRSDRLWPQDCMAYQTNPLSLAYGACGPLLALQELNGSVPASALQWVLDRLPARQALEPGFYVGWSGVGWTLARLGAVDAAVQALDHARSLIHTGISADFFHGLAGIGHAHLALYHATGEAKYLEHVMHFADAILQAATPTASGLCWPTASHKEGWHGLAYGNSGVVSFLVEAHRVSGEKRLLDAAREAAAHEFGAAMALPGELAWARPESLTTKDPYFLSGGCGIALAFLDLWKATSTPYYLDTAKQAMSNSYSRFTVLPSLFEGLAGIGTSLLEFAEATGDVSYRQQAWTLARSILCYQIHRPEGVAFPGRGLLRISADYGYGIAGIACFLSRLLTGRGHTPHSPAYSFSAPGESA